MNAITFLDVKGLNCPLPILKAKKAVKDVAIGDIIEVHTTDPGSVKDFEAFCRQTGHELMQSIEENGIYKYQIKRVS